MTIVRSEVTISATGDVPADDSVNVVYHNITTNLVVGDVGWQNHADEVRDVFSGVSADVADAPIKFFARRQVTVKCYDLADARPRPVHAVSRYIPSSADAPPDLGPRQVALALSYFAGRNLPRTRGRIYLGPFDFTNLTPVPSADMLTSAMAIGHGLFNVGGANVHWQQHSVKDNVTNTITDIWVDDRYDTQKRRLSKASTRQKFTF